LINFNTFSNKYKQSNATFKWKKADLFEKLRGKPLFLLLFIAFPGKLSFLQKAEIFWHFSQKLDKQRKSFAFSHKAELFHGLNVNNSGF